MFKRMWDALMNAKNNTLNSLPKTVRLQLMVSLSFMWSLIFAISFEIMYWFPGLVIVHVILLILGIFGTSWLFSLFDKRK